MTLIDTTVWIDYFGGTANPHTEWLDRELGRQPLGLTDLILCEIMQGIRVDSAFNRVRRDLSRFEIFSAGGEARNRLRPQLSPSPLSWPHHSKNH